MTDPGESRLDQYRFGDFTLDLEGGFLRRGQDEVTLTPKAFEVLAYLVKHRGRLVSKSALIEAVWPDAAITDTTVESVSSMRVLEVVGKRFVAVFPR